MENKYLQVRKETFLSRCIKFIKRLFKNKDEDHKKQEEVTIIEKKEINFNFLNEIKLVKEEDKPILELQKKYENNEIDLSVMTDEEVHELNLLYKKQVAELKKKLESKKLEVKMMRNRITGYSTNM